MSLGVKRKKDFDEFLNMRPDLREAPLKKLEHLPEAPLVRVDGRHAGIGVHRLLPGPSAYVTLLRDPVDRPLSRMR